MRRIIIIALILFSFPTLISAYNDSGMYRDGFKLNPQGNDINLMNRTVWNGSFNGTFVGVQTGSDNMKINKTGDNMTGILSSPSINISSPWDYTNFGIIRGIRYDASGTPSEIRARYYGRLSFFPDISKITTFVDILTEGDNLIYEFQSNSSVSKFRGYRGNVKFETTYFGSIAFSPASCSWGNFTAGCKYGNESLNLTQNDVSFPKLSGSGNAYACFNSSGTIYRSIITCI